MIHRVLLTIALLATYFNLKAQVSPNNPTVQGNTQFALQLYKQLVKSNQQASSNIFVSPYSISSALAMTYAGAKGSTAHQMEKTLYLSKNTINQDYKHLNQHFHQLGSKDLQLSIANALWGEQTTQFLPSFLRLNEQYYQAKLDTLDFKQYPNASRIRINQWVATKTQDKIQELIPAGIINSRTRLVLTNAIYFKGKWDIKFDKRNSYLRNFIANGITYPQVKFMKTQNYIKYAENAFLQAIELPYAQNKMSMVILLPKNKNGLNGVETWLTAKNYQYIANSLFKTKVILHLPKFKMTQNVNLKQTLKAMGMHTPFSRQADFSKITDKEHLVISEVVHKAFIEVSEKGTEAAAATAVVMGLPTAVSYNPKPPVRPKIFKADHPFIFMIKDNATGSIMFIGRFMNPKQAS